MREQGARRMRIDRYLLEEQKSHADWNISLLLKIQTFQLFLM